MPSLNVETKYGRDSVTVEIAGALVPSTFTELENVFDDLLHSQGNQRVVLNLYECEYIDETSVRRLGRLTRELKERLQPYDLYVRPMSFVAYRVKPLSPSSEVPSSISEVGEKRLAERRLARLKRWRKEKPIADLHPPGVITPPELPPEVEVEKALPAQPATKGEDLLPIDFKRVSFLAEKDERVIRRIWETYCRLLDTGAFKEAPDGEATTQLDMDAQVVARELRLNPKDVRKVIESVSTYLIDLLETEDQ